MDPWVRKLRGPAKLGIYFDFRPIVLYAVEAEGHKLDKIKIELFGKPYLGFGQSPRVLIVRRMVHPHIYRDSVYILPFKGRRDSFMPGHIILLSPGYPADSGLLAEQNKQKQKNCRQTQAPGLIHPYYKVNNTLSTQRIGIYPGAKPRRQAGPEQSASSPQRPASDFRPDCPLFCVHPWTLGAQPQNHAPHGFVPGKPGFCVPGTQKCA
jgi:hypothetical protein